jgi:hypothetical protein
LFHIHYKLFLFFIVEADLTKVPGALNV